VKPPRQLGALAVALLVLAPGARAEVAAPPTLEQSGLEPRLGARLPLDARFQSSSGREVALGEALGGERPALLVLAYNRCTMLCSLVLRRVARLVPELGLRPGDDYTLVTASIDPRDTPLEASRLQGLLLEIAGLPGQPERWTFLVGERASVDAVAGAVGFRYAWDEQTEQYAHPAVLISIAPGGTVSGYFDGLDPNLEALRASLTGARPSGGWLEQVISSCFRFDASRSRYGATLAWLLRGSAAGLIFGLALFIWRFGRRRPSPGGAGS
jgi:protein SCO1/2